MGRTRRKAGPSPVDPLRPDHPACGRAAGARDDQRRRGEAGRSPGRPPHPLDHRRRLARAGPAAVSARRAERRPTRDDADRQHLAQYGRSPARRRDAGRRSAAAAGGRPAAGSGFARRRKSGQTCRAPRRMGAVAEDRQWVPARPRRQRPSTAEAIAGVNKRLDAKGLVAFDPRDATDRAKAIARTIGVSVELLSEPERLRFGELGVFPEDVDIPVGVVARLWMATGDLDDFETEDLLSRLFDRSLLLDLDLGQRFFRLHDTVRHFLLDQAGDEGLVALHKQLVEALDGTGSGESDPRTQRYYYLYLPHHLAEA